MTLPPAARAARCAAIADVAARAMYDSGITTSMLDSASPEIITTVKAKLAELPGISKQGNAYKALSEDTLDAARDRLMEMEKSGAVKTRHGASCPYR